MRRFLIPAFAAAALLVPTLAGAGEATSGAATGAVGGAIVGGVVGGPVGAAIGAGVGGTVGAASGEASDRNRGERVIIEERRAPVTERTCVSNAAGTECVETRR